jgi:hypothetical protein
MRAVAVLLLVGCFACAHTEPAPRTSMLLELTRWWRVGEATIGELSVGGVRVCFTLKEPRNPLDRGNV